MVKGWIVGNEIAPRKNVDTARMIVGEVINPFVGLIKHMAYNVRYPTKARDNKTVGSVVIKFAILENKVANPALVTGIGNGCDEEVYRVIKSFTGEIFVKPGQYTLYVTFSIRGENDNDIIQGTPPAPLPPGQFAGEVKIVSFPVRKN